jgi:hypothetical protein
MSTIKDLIAAQQKTLPPLTRFYAAKTWSQYVEEERSRRWYASNV